jgi:hypothetical protein
VGSSKQGRVRWLARWLLDAVARVAPEKSRGWAEAMLAELEYVEDDWEALRWALGSVTAIARHSGWDLVFGLIRKGLGKEEQKVDAMGKKAGMLAVGVLCALALMAAAFGVLYVMAVSFPGLKLEHSAWAHVVFVIVMPLTICVTGAMLLWRSRRPVALGILLSVAVACTHLAVHFAMHFHGH